MDHDNMQLTSAEIASIWTAYINDSMSIRVLEFMIKYTEDPDIKSVLQFAYTISSENIEQIKTIFEKESFKSPVGFTEEDINMDAPWLFTDMFSLSYVHEMARVGMITYSGFVSMSARADIRKHFSNGLSEVLSLYNQSTDVSLAKGLFARAPYMDVPKEVDFVDSKNYLSGLNPFSEQRPLNAVEISYLYMNVLTNAMGVKLCIAFAQTSPKKEIQDFMMRGKAISEKHIKIFSTTLMKDDIQTPRLPDLGVSDSTTKTFSDKLLMFHMSLLTAAGIGNYATAAGASQRSDLAVNYERLSLEIARLTKSGADIMIQNSWLEQPPAAKDIKKLVKKKK